MKDKYLLKAWLIVVWVLCHQGLDRDEDRGDALSRAPGWPCPCPEYQMHDTEKSYLNFKQLDFNAGLFKLNSSISGFAALQVPYPNQLFRPSDQFLNKDFQHY